MSMYAPLSEYIELTAMLLISVSETQLMHLS